jgi:hypothetical protein
MGTEGNCAKSVQIDHEERQERTSEERIRLVVGRLPLGDEFAKTPEFSAEWMVNQAQEAARKLSGEVRHPASSVPMRVSGPVLTPGRGRGSEHGVHRC